MIETPKTNPSTVSADVLAAALDKWNQAGEQHLIPIVGSSMLPLIQPGNQVLVEHGYANVQRGDVIVFLQQEKLVAHRLLRICNDGPATTFITKGDNASYLDSPVSASKVVGRVLKIKRGSRWISIDTRAWSIGGWLIAVCMLAWAMFYGWGRRVKHRLFGQRI